MRTSDALIDVTVQWREDGLSASVLNRITVVDQGPNFRNFVRFL